MSNETGLTSRERRKLQAMINRTVKTAEAWHREQEALNEWCIARYGYEPGDQSRVDADDILDGVLGAAGVPCGMDADDFERVMREVSA